LDPLKKEILGLESTKKVLIGGVESLQGKKRDTFDEIELLKSDALTLQTQIDEFTARLSDLNDTTARKRGVIVGLSEQIGTLKGSILPLEDSKRSLEESIGLLIDKREDLVEQIGELEIEIASKKETAERDLNTILLRASTAREEYNQFTDQMKVERENIAVRARSLDDKDKVLRVREIKVTQQEASIKQNAALLEM
jgi:chromosome segregation ATPase